MPKTVEDRADLSWINSIPQLICEHELPDASFLAIERRAANGSNAAFAGTKRGGSSTGGFRQHQDVAPLRLHCGHCQVRRTRVGQRGAGA